MLARIFACSVIVLLAASCASSADLSVKSEPVSLSTVVLTIKASEIPKVGNVDITPTPTPVAPEEPRGTTATPVTKPLLTPTPTMTPELFRNGRLIRKTCTDGKAEISSPTSGSTVGQKFSIFGSAFCIPSTDLKYYKIELLGQGCGTDKGCFVCEGKSVVLAGKLCSVDLTQGNPNGFYELRLTVVGIDSIDYAIFPKTPRISINIAP